VLLVVIGVLWTLQGLGRLGGSAMTGEPIWAIIGPAVAAGGLALAFSATRRRDG
jgi:hypothetical protein